MIGSSKDQLTSILKGDLKGIKKTNTTIVIGPRVRNIMWKKLVNKFKKEGINTEEIINKILEFDDLVEQGYLTQELIDKQ